MVTEKEKTILVVDNQPLILKYVSDLLEKNGYRVKTAEDGLSAIDILKTFSPDYFLVDLIMPNIDGATLCKIIRQDHRFQSTPLFILSAVAAEYSVNLNELGANLCIAKGPLQEMGHNILEALAHTKLQTDPEKPVKVIGAENLHPRRASKELITSNKHYEDILEHISDGILEINKDGRIIFINSTAANCLSSSKEKLLGTEFIIWFDEQVRKTVLRYIESTEAEETTDPIRQGERFLSIKTMPVKSGTDIRVILIRDVTKDEISKQTLIALSRTDPLTKIGNRRWFDERLKEEWKRMLRENSELSLLLCDVDNLKEINDSYGHSLGDECLRAVAKTLATQTKRPADFSARYGGDEFALILPNTHEKGALHIADQLREKVFNMEIEGITGSEKAKISLSIGIATARPKANESFEILLTVADDAMYQAKNEGRNRVVSKLVNKKALKNIPMNDYWHGISEAHKEKVRKLAEKNDITLEQAFRNILKQIELDLDDELRTRKLEDLLTIRHVEKMVDSIKM
jgi:diguanylate cyclase (GGDEF)-like protein/PAS domain S-box-containing protein